jgi:hypothetical protein
MTTNICRPALIVNEFDHGIKEFSNNNELFIIDDDNLLSFIYLRENVK